MTRVLKSVSFTLLAVGITFASEKPVKMKNLPAAVQKAVQDQTKGADLKALAKEVENGKTFYEAQTLVNGRSRDIIFDPEGVVVQIEEEVALDSIPGPAKAAIEKGAAGGEISKVEALTKGSAVTYEAAITKGGKNLEIVVAADGSVQQ